MFEALVEWAGQSSTAWTVLACATCILVVKAASESQVVFWGEFTDDDESAV